jgi:hypothetical protein
LQHPAAVLDTFDLLGVPCRIDCADEAFARLLGERYAAFGTDAAPRITLAVEVTGPVPDGGAPVTWEPHTRVRGRAARLAIDGLGFRGRFDERTGRGRLSQPGDPAPLETFLTAILARHLLREGGCLLHAAALAAPDGARVFFGPSGSGKTTVTELVGEGIITDEITALRRAGSGFTVSAPPWRGARREARLAGLFHLRAGGETAFARLAPAEATRRLLGSVFFARADGAEITRFLATAEALLAAVPCHEMRFTRDRAFWDALPGRAVGA